MIWDLTQRQLIRIKQNFEDGKYKMMETDHQKFVVIGVSWWVPEHFLGKKLKGDWDRKRFQDNKNFETFIEFHLLLVCKV